MQDTATCQPIAYLEGEPRSGFSPQMVDAYLGTDVGCRELGFCFQNTWLAMQRPVPMNRHVVLVFADEWGLQSSTTVGNLVYYCLTRMGFKTFRLECLSGIFHGPQTCTNCSCDGTFGATKFSNLTFFGVAIHIDFHRLAPGSCLWF